MTSDSQAVENFVKDLIEAFQVESLSVLVLKLPCSHLENLRFFGDAIWWPNLLLHVP